MLSIFRTNQLLASFLLVFYLAILHAPAWLASPTYSLPAVGFLGQFIYEHISPDGYLGRILTILIVLFQAFFINVLVRDFRLSREINLFPGLFFALIASSFPEFLVLSPVHLANTFLLVAFYQIANTYRRSSSAAGLIFNAGFWIGIASFIYPSYILFGLYIVVGLETLRALRMGEVLIALCGLVTPYLLAGAAFFWFDELPYLYRLQFVEGLALGDFPSPDLSLLNIIRLGLYGLILLIVLFSFNLYKFKKVIQVQKRISLLYWMLIVGFFTMLIQGNIQMDHLLVLAIPLGIFLSFNISEGSPNWAALWHFLLFGVILLLHFYPIVLSV
ncbi:MAG: hypothetical protein R3350_01540 [Saprospiraceae bacterium]|nr:hypothetical protein [Saprospiraceae bacterium]